MPFIKISGLTTATAVSATNQFEINQNGGSRSATVAQVAAFARTSATEAVVLPAGTVSAPGLTFTGDTNTGIYSPAADTIAFAEGGVEAMRIDSSANVGIGTATPAARLNIVDATSQDAVRITQTGAGNALVVEDSANPDATPFVVNADGNVLLGTTTTRTIAGQVPEFLIERPAAARAAVVRNTADANGPLILTAKSRGTTNGSYTVVASGDALGTWNFAGSDGTADVIAASIRADVDGTPGTNDMPGRLVFSTTADGASSPTERMRITNAGRVGIGTSAPDNILTVAASDTSNSLSNSAAAITLFNSNSDAFGRTTNLNFNQGNSVLAQRLASIAAIYTNFTSSVGGALAFSTNNGSGTVAERMRIDASGNVGVGTASPTNAGAGARFVTTAASTVAAYQAFGGSSTDARVFADNGYGGTGMFSNHPFLFYTNSAERMRIDSAGNVGIGTSAPVGKLDIVTGVNRAYFDDAGGSLVRLNGVVANNTAYGPIAVNGSQVLLTTGAVERMRIDDAGNVGIGTSSPNYRLQSHNAGGTANYLQITNSSSGSASGDGMLVGTDTPGDAIVWMQENTSLKFGTNNTERARITSGGNLLVGTTVNNGNRLVASGGTNGMVTDFINTTANGSYITITQDTVENWAIGQPAGVGALVFTQGRNTASAGTERARIDASGSFLLGTTVQPSSTQAGIRMGPSGFIEISRGAGTTVWNQMSFANGNGYIGFIQTSGSSTSYITSSDYRLKENVVPLTGAAARVQALKPSRFNFIADPDRTMDGFLAHEAAEVVPEAVTGEKDAVNDDGSIKPQGIDHSKLVPLLTAALQEALTEIASLKARVAILENK